MATFFHWAGDKVLGKIDEFLDSRMDQTGRRIAQRARELAPMRTGKLRDSIGYVYRQSDKRLILHADVPYAFFVEFGTRRMRAQPFFRPAILQEGPTVFGPKGGIEMQFAEINTSGTMPMPRANAAAIKHNTATNTRLNKAIGGKARTTFHGDTAASMRGHRPAIKRRYGVNRRKPRS